VAPAPAVAAPPPLPPLPLPLPLPPLPLPLPLPPTAAVGDVAPADGGRTVAAHDKTVTISWVRTFNTPRHIGAQKKRPPDTSGL